MKYIKIIAVYPLVLFLRLVLLVGKSRLSLGQRLEVESVLVEYKEISKRVFGSAL